VAVPLIAVLHATEGGFANVFAVLALLAAGMLAASLFFPTRDALVASRARAAQPA
jgi:hypothetical protein